MSAAKAASSSSARLMDVRTAMAYLSMGQTLCRDFCESIGAVRKFGTRVLYDRKAIDAALDRMGESANEMGAENGLTGINGDPKQGQRVH